MSTISVDYVDELLRVTIFVHIEVLTSLVLIAQNPGSIAIPYLDAFIA